MMAFGKDLFPGIVTGGKILFALEIASFYAFLKSEGHRMTRVADTQIMKQNDDGT